MLERKGDLAMSTAGGIGTEVTRASDLSRLSDSQHLMLLYDDEQDRNSAEIECLNRALEAGQFCVYATVDAHEIGFTDRLAAKITN